LRCKPNINLFSKAKNHAPNEGYRCLEPSLIRISKVQKCFPVAPYFRRPLEPPCLVSFFTEYPPFYPKICSCSGKTTSMGSFPATVLLLPFPLSNPHSRNSRPPGPQLLLEKPGPILFPRPIHPYTPFLHPFRVIAHEVKTKSPTSLLNPVFPPPLADIHSQC